MNKFKKIVLSSIAAISMFAMAVTSYAGSNSSSTKISNFIRQGSVNTGAGGSYNVGSGPSYSFSVNGKEVRTMPATTNIFAGESVRIQGLVDSSAARLSSFTLKSSNSKVVSVQKVNATTKKIVGVKPGSAKIAYSYTLKSGTQRTGSFKVQVKKNSITCMTLSEASSKMTEKSTRYYSGDILVLSLNHISGGGKYEWSMPKNSPAVFLYKNGSSAIIALTKNGTAKITAKSNGAATTLSVKSGKCKRNYSISINKGKNASLVNAMPASAKWTSKNKKVVSVSRGIIKGLKKGNAKVEASGKIPVKTVGETYIGNKLVTFSINYKFDAIYVYNVAVKG